MRFKIILLLLVMTLLLGWVVFNMMTKTATLSPEELAKIIYRFNPEDIQTVSFINKEESMSLQRTDDGWLLLEQDMELDQTLVDEMVFKLANLTAERVIKEVITEDDIHEFGFDQGVYLWFGLSDGRYYEGWRGSIVPTLDAYYFLYGNRIFRVDTFDSHHFEPNLLKVRRREIFNTNLAELNRLEILYATGVSIVIEGSESGWFFIRDDERKSLEIRSAEGWLKELLGIIMNNYFIKELEEDEFSNPFMVFTVEGERGIEIIEIGKSNSDQIYYAKKSGVEEIYEVGETGIERVLERLETLLR